MFFCKADQSNTGHFAVSSGLQLPHGALRGGAQVVPTLKIACHLSLGPKAVPVYHRQPNPLLGTMSHSVELAATCQANAQTYSSGVVAKKLFADHEWRADLAAIKATDLLINTMNSSRPSLPLCAPDPAPHHAAQYTNADALRRSKAVTFLSLFLGYVADTSAGKLSTKLEQDEAMTAIFARLQQPMYLDQDAQADNPVRPTIGTYCVLLRSAMLLLKTVMLVAAQDSPANKHLIQQALWAALKQTAGSLQDLQHKAACSYRRDAQELSSSEAAEAGHLAVLLVKLLWPILHQSIAADKLAYKAAGIVCETLCAVMASSRCAIMQMKSQACAMMVVEMGENKLTCTF